MRSPRLRTFSPGRIAATYAVIGAVWILLSDVLLTVLVPEATRAAPIAAVKGLLFVVGTTALIWTLMVRARARLQTLKESLLRTEGRYRLLVEGSDDVFFFLQDREGRFQYLSPSVEAVLGFAPAELIGHRGDVLSFEPAVTVGQSPDSLGSTPGMVLWARRKDGERVLLEVTQSSLVRGTENDGVHGFARDVTERQRMEQALRESEARFRRMAETISAAVFIYRGTRLEYVNTTASVLTGYTSEELRERDFWEIVHPDDREMIRERGLARQSGEAVEPHYEFRIVHRDGRERWVDFTAGVITHAGEPAVLGTAFDITDHKQAEAALREVEERFRQMAGSLREVFWLSDLKTRRPLYVSPAFQRVWGISAEEHYADPARAFSLIHPDDREAALAAFEGMRCQSVTEHEYRIIRPDGAVRWLSTRTFPVLDAEGTPYRTAGITADITARKDAEQALRESEERFRGIFEQSSFPIYVSSLEGRVIDVNPAMTEVFGMPPEATRGRWLTDFYADPAERAAFQRRLTAEGSVREYELRLRRSSGETFDALVSATLLRTSAGQVLGYLGMVRDVTERKRAEIALRESEERYRMVVEHSPDAILIHHGGRLTFINPAGVRLLGAASSEALLGRSVMEFVHPDSRPVVTERLRLLGEQDQPQPPLLEKMLRLDGSTVYAEVTAVPLPSAERPGVQVVARDITERVLAEAHYRRLVDTLTVGMYVLDAEGRFTEINPAAEAILARRSEDVLGAALAEIVAPEDGEMVTEVFRRVMAGEQVSVEFDMRIVRPSGERRMLQITGTNIQDDGRITGALGVARDITEEHAREQQLRRAERLASLGTLVSGVAHELNNPLTSIKSFAQLMLQDGRDAEDREALEIICREAERMARIVSDLRVLSRQTQADTGTREPVDLNDVVRHVLRLRHYALSTSNIQLVQELATGLPLIQGDRGEIEQVAINLLINAEQALAQWSGQRSIRVRTRSAGHGVILEIQDSGPGIAREHMGRIFDPFFTTKAPGEGTGLGLSLIHRIVSEHGGRVAVESQAGNGAVFRVELPREEGGGGTVASARSVAQAIEPLRILVVDDEEPIRRVVGRHLRRRGHQVDEAHEGQNALERLRSWTYDVVLTDLRMPGLGGEEFLSSLRQLDPRLPERLVVMTGDAAGTESAAALAAVGAPVLMKPFDLDELVRLVEQRGAGA